MNYKELICERPHQRATIELDAKELYVIKSMFKKLENDEKYILNEQFNNLRKEFFLLYHIVNDGFVGEETLNMLTEMVDRHPLSIYRTKGEK